MNAFPADPSASAIRSRGLAKVYGGSDARPVRALDGIDFEVAPGEIFGLIGADGAGKTTAFKILAGVMEPTEGDVIVLGKRPRESRERVGYLTQPFSLYTDLTVMENLRYSAGLKEVPAADFAEGCARYLGLFDMESFTGRLASQLSGGMKQKLSLSCALIADAQLLLLDEPTTGVDPVSRRDFWDALTSLSTEGMTIVVATPYLDEAERCHRVALMERGKIIQIDRPAAFRSGLGLKRLEVYGAALRRAEETLAAAAGRGGIEDVQRFGDRLDVMVRSAEEGEETVRGLLEQAEAPAASVRLSPPTLENAVVATLRRMRGAEAAPPFPERSSPALPRQEEQDGVAIGAYQLNKRFGSFQAVKDFNLEVRYGEIYGLLGANGAGKTTAIKMLCKLLRPTSGEIALLGRSRQLRTAKARSQIGYMSQKFTLYDDLTIGENLDFYAGVNGVPSHLRSRRKQWVLETSGLGGQDGLLTGLLPGGWKQRVAFGSALMHEPRVVFLDEPTSGVDPLARRAMWRMINELADWGAAVLVVTHYLEEAEQCNRLGFMADGEIIAQGRPGEVKQLMQGHLLEMETTAPQRALRLLKQHFGASRLSLFGDRLHFVVADEARDLDAAGAILAREGIQVRRAEPIRFSLEDVFISLIEARRKEDRREVAAQ